MPGLPSITPYVPKVPPIELPPEIPWPPEIAWPPIPAPWIPQPTPWSIPGLELLPPCWPEFANRFMALAYRVLVFRLSAGFPVQALPFDLRTWATATPEMVELASLYVAELMWNSMASSGESTIVAKVPRDEMDCTAYKTNPSGFDYADAVVYLSRGAGIGASFSVRVPAASSITTATLTLTTDAPTIGYGTLYYRVRAAKGSTMLMSHSSYVAARSAAVGVSRQFSMRYLDRGIAILHDVTDLVQACAGAGGITFCVDDWDGESSPSTTRNGAFHARYWFPEPDGMEPTLTIVRSGFSLPRLEPYRAKTLECARLMQWLAYAEAVVSSKA